MPFVLLAIGAIFLVSGIRGTQSDYTVSGQSYPGLFTLIKGDFSGNANFLYWFGAIFLIGCVGYVKQLKAVSDGFIMLVIVSMFVAKSANGTTGGFFQKALAALNTPSIGSPDNTSASTAANNSAVASGAVTSSPTGESILGNGVTNLGTSLFNGSTGSGAVDSGVGGVTNFGTSF
jgi:hypothetical protein